MRVIAGNNRGLNLLAPEGMDTRPTTDRIKETLFNMISFDIPDCNFLDLFSGSGQMGIEALSRGANHAVFVDRCRAAQLARIRQMSSKVWRGSACEYQADEQAGVAGLSWRVSGR